MPLKQNKTKNTYHPPEIKLGTQLSQAWLLWVFFGGGGSLHPEGRFVCREHPALAEAPDGGKWVGGAGGQGAAVPTLPSCPQTSPAVPSISCLFGGGFQQGWEQKAGGMA